jgi:hypothetical protein
MHALSVALRRRIPPSGPPLRIFSGIRKETWDKCPGATTRKLHPTADTDTRLRRTRIRKRLFGGLSHSRSGTMAQVRATTAALTGRSPTGIMVNKGADL